jgi:CRISPR/Cas system-associated protein Cas7 (RAMP superfamily)
MQKSTRRSQQALSTNSKTSQSSREVQELLPEFAGLYDDDYIAINEDNLSDLERIFNTNINLYHYVDGRARIITAARSQTSNEPRYRLLYVPYSSMVPVKQASNVKAFALGSKSSADFAAEIDEDPEATSQRTMVTSASSLPNSSHLW